MSRLRVGRTRTIARALAADTTDTDSSYRSESEKQTEARMLRPELQPGPPAPVSAARPAVIAVAAAAAIAAHKPPQVPIDPPRQTVGPARAAAAPRLARATRPTRIAAFTVRVSTAAAPPRLLLLRLGAPRAERPRLHVHRRVRSRRQILRRRRTLSRREATRRRQPLPAAAAAAAAACLSSGGGGWASVGHGWRRLMMRCCRPLHGVRVAGPWRRVRRVAVGRGAACRRTRARPNGRTRVDCGDAAHGYRRRWLHGPGDGGGGGCWCWCSQ
jgi:hypothetical protein